MGPYFPRSQATFFHVFILSQTLNLRGIGEKIFPISAEAVFNLSHSVKQKLWARIDSLLYALSLYYWDDVLTAVKGIIGFGPGLTPSGDDFLSGFILTGVILSKICPHLGETVEKLVTILSKESMHRTTYVSISMIEDASNGEAAEPVLKLIHKILLSDDLGQIKYFAKQLGSIGGSSGEDLYNGLATGVWFFSKIALKGISHHDGRDCWVSGESSLET